MKKTNPTGKVGFIGNLNGAKAPFFILRRGTECCRTVGERDYSLAKLRRAAETVRSMSSLL
ncbi:hypothetical protein EC836_11046 [Erwinia sp. JUb26]|nr:hypothetical protein EC836_11046 [Erwinia sp. JUb26]